MASKEQKHTKKVVIKDELSSPEARADRLRRVRNMANLSRKEICDTEELNVNTYKGWEIARYGGLPLDGAHKVIKRIAKAGVICTADWLLHGGGSEPYTIPKTTKINRKAKPEDTTQADENIIQEIMVFQSHFANAIYTNITDDALFPKIKIGDYVAGIRYFDKEIKKYIDEDCILQTRDGRILVRQLKKSRDQDTYMLICTNSQTSVDMPVLYDVELESAAPILRIYRASLHNIDEGHHGHF